MQFAMDFFARPHQHKGHFTLTLTYASLHWCMFISFVHTTVLFSIETIVKDASKRWWWFFSLHYCTRLLRVVHIIAPLCNRYSSLFVTGSIHLSDRILNVLFHHLSDIVSSMSKLLDTSWRRSCKVWNASLKGSFPACRDVGPLLER